MKIIILALLTLVLVSCGEIRLEIGGDDFEVGEWVWMPQPDTPRLDQFGGVILNRDGLHNAYLVNTRSGDVRSCTTRENDERFDCTMVYSEAKRVIEDGFD